MNNAFLFHLPCKSETERNLNLDDYPNQKDLLYLVNNLERQLRDSDEKIDELKQQIWELERNVARMESQQGSEQNCNEKVW